MKYTKTEKGIIIVLARGENVIETLTAFCAENKIIAGVFQGIGAVERVKIGYYDLGKKEYFFRDLSACNAQADEAGVFEVASMQGNVALVDGKPFIHAHAVLSRCDATCECIGAHIKEAFVAVTLEIYLTPLDVVVSRKLDEAIGLKLLDI
ncbi:MAG: PPC domain-containing DNA-binding protein [Patescibacteria group bacterium]